tara:strand:- start:63 stop:983 length:921 start_codon:yes stop_codon:yes gene_type:complete
MDKIIKITIPVTIIIFSIIIMSTVQFGDDELTNAVTIDSKIIRNESSDVITVDKIIEEYHELHTVKMSSTSIFDIYYTEKDAELFRTQAISPENGVKLEFNNKSSEFYQSLKPNEKTIVVYPIFTAAAYSIPGFYDYYSGDCDESCLTNVSFENPMIEHRSTGMSTMILHGLGYDFITDIDIDKNQEILQEYETVILLHNEYVTQKMFDAISSHPNLIFLSPNALYALIEVNYDNNTITLIRGHDYPPGVSNAFDYDIEEKFHQYEYDLECLNWEFIKIKNGYHINCYPDEIIYNNLDILLAMKEL